MKKLMVGICVFLWGWILLCTLYLESAIKDAMPGVTVTGAGAGQFAAGFLILTGAALMWAGYRARKDSNENGSDRKG